MCWVNDGGVKYGGATPAAPCPVCLLEPLPPDKDARNCPVAVMFGMEMTERNKTRADAWVALYRAAREKSA